MFSVKSAYHLQVSIHDSKSGQGSRPSNHGVLWKLLWKLKVPNKVKMFLWRVAKDILPTRANLYRRKIIESPLCPICHSFPKTTAHVLWSCRAAQDVWSHSSKRLRKCRTEEQPFHELLTDHLSLLPAEEHVELVLTATELWHRRKKFIFESSFTSPLQISKIVSTRKSELEELNSQPQEQSLSTRVPVKWCKPPTNFYKINWDVAIDRVNCMVGIGVAVRDWDGLVTGTLRSPRNSFPDPLLGEALATL
ncbi:uncharacterized protein LOC122293585 [Carya illinoinensis]|uniref:uncharacterized protein LOC122293585 n=1 Tax=Carya illinoinensis TaxID=32201 RepID=UPI001C7248EB|nr:uncharacterized protein LOC122293585 [Carya illinoinensis]